VRADYGRSYRELYERHWWWRAREELILRVLNREQPPQGWKTVLDVGCGDGLFLDRLSRFGEVEGVEPAEELVNRNGPHRARIHIAPFNEDLRLHKQFALILMLDVLEHLPDPVSALRYALTLLDANGLLLVTVPAFRVLWTGHDVINHHVTRYTKKSFRELALRAGLEVETERYFFHWLFPVKLATRVAEEVLRMPPTPATVPGPWTNRLLHGLSRFEQKTWGRLRVPFGSSLMVLGRKRIPSRQPAR
jgi:2-polyprenyl-3-methyl-5-hydroxy-6-metoxy-1,4-benzoquinol methylase